MSWLTDWDEYWRRQDEEFERERREMQRERFEEASISDEDCSKSVR